MDHAYFSYPDVMPLDKVEAIIFTNGPVQRKDWMGLVQSSEAALMAHKPAGVNQEIFEYCFCSSKMLIAVHLMCIMVEELQDLVDSSTALDQWVEQAAIDAIHSMYALASAVKHAGDTDSSLEKALTSHLQTRAA